MLKTMKKPRNAKPDGTSVEPSDAALMLAVAERRDVAAFEMLYHRYERPAYNLARYLTVSSPSAEEAVQEAMMRVWRSASNFRPDGRFKGWFLAIVADCSIDQMRRKSREKSRVERHAKDQPRDNTKDPGADMERHELTRALHSQMEQLDTLDRRLLALYYGADMSQQEIGRVLDVPQTTVSMKLRDALAKLRTGLTSAGFAGAVPMLEAGQLGDALLGGAQAPALLHGKVLKGLSPVGRHSARAGAAASKGGAGIWAAIMLCVAAVGGGAYFWANAQPPSAAPPVQTGATAQVPSAVGAYLKYWDFNVTKPYPEFTVGVGKLMWLDRGGPDGSGSIESDAEVTAIFFELPKDAALPLEITFRATAMDPPKKDVVAAAVGYTEFGAWSAAFLNLPMPELPHGEQAWCSFRTVLSERFSDGWVDGKRYGLFAYDNARAGKVGLVLKGRMRLDDLCIRNLAFNDVPDASPFAAAIDRIPPEQRTGEVPAPELPAADTPKTARIMFLPAGMTHAPHQQVWDFTQKALPDSDFRKGGVWSHVPCKEGGKCLESRVDKNGLSFRLERLALPVRVRVQARPVAGAGAKEYFVYPRHLKVTHGAFFHGVGEPAPAAAKDEWFHYEFYIHGDLVDHRIGGTRILATWLDPEPGSPLWLIFDGPQQIRRIEIDEVKPEDSPGVAPLRKALEAIPAAQRKGRVDLPPGDGLPAGAYLEFDPKRLMEQIQIGD